MRGYRGSGLGGGFGGHEQGRGHGGTCGKLRGGRSGRSDCEGSNISFENGMYISDFTR